VWIWAPTFIYLFFWFTCSNWVFSSIKITACISCIECVFLCFSNGIWLNWSKIKFICFWIVTYISLIILLQSALVLLRDFWTLLFINAFLFINDHFQLFVIPDNIGIRMVSKLTFTLMVQLHFLVDKRLSTGYNHAFCLLWLFYPFEFFYGLYKRLVL